MKRILVILKRYKYEVLLIALLQHLFIGIFLTNFEVYTKLIWPINMVLLGLASIGVFINTGKWQRLIKNALFVATMILPLCLPFVSGYSWFMFVVSIAYVAFFVFIFWEIIKFLIQPGYINSDIITAAACGYLLLVEISTFLFQSLLYNDPSSFKGLEIAQPAATYMNLVYFSSVILTSIGFGDIAPNTHVTRLITAFFGIAGQFYSVVLVGILISKFSSKQQQDELEDMGKGD